MDNSTLEKNKSVNKGKTVHIKDDFLNFEALHFDVSDDDLNFDISDELLFK